jgi:hypothetical protein
VDRAVAARTKYFLVVKVRIIVYHIVKTDSHGVRLNPFSEVLSCVVGKEGGAARAYLAGHITDFGFPATCSHATMAKAQSDKRNHGGRGPDMRVSEVGRRSW